MSVTEQQWEYFHPDIVCYSVPGHSGEFQVRFLCRPLPMSQLLAHPQQVPRPAVVEVLDGAEPKVLFYRPPGWSIEGITEADYRQKAIAIVHVRQAIIAEREARFLVEPIY